MTKDDLFTSICNGDIQNSILLSTKIIFIDESFDILELIYIDVCAYIGTFIYITDVGKLIDIYEDIVNMIDNDKIIIKNIYIIITKLCILCDIYNKHPVAKCGNMSITTLKNKISHILNENDMKLSQNGIMRFDGILPPHNHENYNTSLGIIAIIIKTIKSTDDLSSDDINKLVDISNNLRLILDYVLRKKIRIETKFYSTDDDISWFIWGVYSILYNEKIFENSFKLYNHEYKKKYKVKRQGLLYVLGLLCIYVHKQDISKGWTSKEQNVIDKIDEISIKLYNEIRKDLISKNPDLYEKATKQLHEDKTKETDGLEFIINYIPEIDSNKDDNMTTKEYKTTYKETPRIIDAC
jgi:hypothetical protein